MFNGILLIVSLLLLLLIGGTIWLSFAYQKLSQKYSKLQNEIDRIDRDLVSISTAAVEVDGQLSSNSDILQGILKEIATSKDSDSEASAKPEQEISDKPYQDIIEMVQKGAEPSELVRHFGVSYDEADLLIRLHGVEKIK